MNYNIKFEDGDFYEDFFIPNPEELFKEGDYALQYFGKHEILYTLYKNKIVLGYLYSINGKIISEYETNFN